MGTFGGHKVDKSIQLEGSDALVGRSVGGGQSLVLSEACSVRVLMWNVTRTSKKKRSQKWKIEMGDSFIALIRKKRITKKGKRVVDGFLLLCNFKHGRNNNEGEG